MKNWIQRILYYSQSELNERVNLVSANRGGYNRLPMLRYDPGNNANQIPTINSICCFK